MRTQSASFLWHAKNTFFYAGTTANCIPKKWMNFSTLTPNSHANRIKVLHNHLLHPPHDRPMPCNFLSQVVAPWGQESKKLALRHFDFDQDSLEEVTYQQLVKRSTQAAAFLRSHGFVKGDKLALMLGQHPAWWYTLLASLHEGIGIIPCSRLLTPEDLKYRIDYLGIKGLITVPELEERVNTIRHECPSLNTTITTGKSSTNWLAFDEALNSDSTGITPADTTNRDSWIYLYTSGTTGLPKPVEHNHDYPFFHVPTGNDWMQAGHDDVVYNASDTGWGFTVWTTVATWAMGAKLLIASSKERFNAKKMLTLLEEQSVTIFCAAPTVLRLLAADPCFSEFCLPKLKRIVTVGEALDETVIKAFKAKDVDIHVGFGQAETPLLMARWANQSHIPNTMGKASTYRIVLLDENFQPVPVDEPGQIAVDLSSGKRGVMKGYARSPEATNKAFSPDGRYYLTGDWASYDKDGNFRYEGRKDDLLKSRGYRIGPDEIEKAGMSHPAVAKIAVVQVPIKVGSQNCHIKAFVLLKESYQPTDELAKSIRSHIKDQTAPYKRPDFIAFLSPEKWSQYETTSGKIRRKALRELALEELKEESNDLSISPTPR